MVYLTNKHVIPPRMDSDLWSPRVCLLGLARSAFGIERLLGRQRRLGVPLRHGPDTHTQQLERYAFSGATELSGFVAPNTRIARSR